MNIIAFMGIMVFFLVLLLIFLLILLNVYICGVIIILRGLIFDVLLILIIITFISF